MYDKSDLDQKYFISPSIYNCPFCNRRHVTYYNKGSFIFDWSNEKECSAWFIKCASCKKTSMHLTFDDLQDHNYGKSTFVKNVDLDSAIFYSVPTSFFVVDARIPKILRELITEAEGCIKMNYLTGASVCTRKAIYELTVLTEAKGNDYEERIKYLKGVHTNVDPDLFDILCHIKDMTSDKVHEQSWDKWDTSHLKFFLETLKAILHELYVIPDDRAKRSKSIRVLIPEVVKKKPKATTEKKVE